MTLHQGEQMIEPKSGPTYAESRQGVMNTRSGIKFSLLSPRASDVRIEDIAHHLSQINRFTGATIVPYNVAEHSCHVHDWVAQRTACGRTRLAALLHDGAEAYCGDMSKPMKDAMRALTLVSGRSVYDKIEARVMAAIRAHFDLPVEQSVWALVKQGDNAVYINEAQTVMGNPEAEPRVMSAREAELAMLIRYRECVALIEKQRRKALAQRRKALAA